MSSGSRWVGKCQGWLLHTPSRPGPGSLLEGQRDFFQPFPRSLQPETLQMKVQKNQRLLAMYSIWAEIRTSVLSMNPISFIIWLSKKKCTIMIHRRNWWQGSNLHSAAGCRLRGSRTPGDERPRAKGWEAPAATAGYLESATLASRSRGHLGTGRKRVKQMLRVEENEGKRGERGEMQRERMGGRRERHKDLSHQARVREAAEREKKSPYLQITGAAMSQHETRITWVCMAATPLPRRVTSGKSPNHFVPWFPQPMRGKNHGTYRRVHVSVMHTKGSEEALRECQLPFALLLLPSLSSLFVRLCVPLTAQS